MQYQSLVQSGGRTFAQTVSVSKNRQGRGRQFILYVIKGQAAAVLGTCVLLLLLLPLPGALQALPVLLILLALEF